MFVFSILIWILFSRWHIRMWEQERRASARLKYIVITPNCLIQFENILFGLRFHSLWQLITPSYSFYNRINHVSDQRSIYTYSCTRRNTYRSCRLWSCELWVREWMNDANEQFLCVKNADSHRFKRLFIQLNRHEINRLIESIWMYDTVQHQPVVINHFCFASSR